MFSLEYRYVHTFIGYHTFVYGDNTRYKSYRAYPVNIDLTADDTRHFQLGMRCTVAANMQDKRRGYISTHARVGNNSLLYKEPVMAVEM